MELNNADPGYPRVLVVDAVAFHRRMDTGILKSNLFHGWPSDSLAQVIIGEDIPDFTICEKYWRITRGDKFRARTGKEIACKPVNAQLGGVKPKDENALRSSDWGVQMRTAMGSILWDSRTRIDNEFRNWLTEARPQVIFTLGASLGVFSAVRRLSDDFKIPVVPYFTDDWIRWIYKRGPLHSLLLRKMNAAFSDCLRRSPLRLTISEAMAQEYARRYGGEFLPCMDTVNLEALSYKPYEVQRRPIKFLFVGYLEPERWRSLKLIGDSLTKLRAQGIDATLDIYTFPDQIAKYGSLLHSPPAVEIRGTVPPEQVFALLSDADVLVHVEAFGLQDDAMIALSLSTKIPQYMSAGRAVLGVGPGYSASMIYVEQSGAGIVAGEQSEPALTEALRTLATDAELRVRLAHNARQTAQTNHDAITGRERFKSILSDAVQSGLSTGA